LEKQYGLITGNAVTLDNYNCLANRIQVFQFIKIACYEYSHCWRTILIHYSSRYTLFIQSVSDVTTS